MHAASSILINMPLIFLPSHSTSFGHLIFALGTPAAWHVRTVATDTAKLSLRASADHKREVRMRQINYIGGQLQRMG
eukprot:m.138314 g.138314  ORF g.138314 m.138314 type:complete len:77 (+) comp14011_c1_seq2:1473-1703(+)